jgi:hypothetical protein
MNNPAPSDPRIVTHNIPKIEVYQVTDDELRRIEDGCNLVAQDLTFAVAFLSAALTLGIALFSGTFSLETKLLFIVLMVLFLIVGFYTGFKWFRVRKKTPTVITEIRSRKVDPEEPE